MKHAHILLSILSGIILPAIIISCEDMMGDYLEKPAGSDVTEDVIFSSQMQMETFLATIYQYGIHSNLPYSYQSETPGNKDGLANPDESLSAGATDEAETVANWYEPQKWNGALVGPDNIDDRRFEYRFNAIRMITVMLERVDEVPDMTPEYKEQIKAEVKFIRALNYFEMLKRYGGMPIIDHRIGLDENLKIPRAGLEETFNFILQDIEEALPHLPNRQTGHLAGRVHQGAALALRSKTLLYAASPLFNTATPYLDFGGHNNLICLGNNDAGRWKTAAEAAKAVLDWAATATPVCELITDQGVDKNYKYSWEIYDNKEIIFCEKSMVELGTWTWPWNAWSPIYPGNKGESGITPLLNFVRKYEKTGKAELQTWNDVGVKGNDLQEKMAELDARFKQTICYNMSDWNEERKQVELYKESKASNRKIVDNCFGGFWLHKLYPDRLTDKNYKIVPNSTLFQLNEIYLNYAEAMNEAYGPDNNNGYRYTAREAVNIIRSRSGQPAIASGSAPYPSFRELIRHERAIELAFDNQRFWDIRRWMIAEEEGVMRGDMIGIKITMIAPDVPVSISSGFAYEPYIFEKRNFSRKMYLHPFSTNEVNKGYLVQNPGY
jgi:hypothetical protein